jgi:hypothetical protein
MAIFSNIFLSFSTQNPRASARGQKSGFFQFFLKTKLMPEVSVFQQSTIIFYWVGLAFSQSAVSIVCCHNCSQHYYTKFQVEKEKNKQNGLNFRCRYCRRVCLAQITSQKSK